MIDRIEREDEAASSRELYVYATRAVVREFTMRVEKAIDGRCGGTPERIQVYCSSRAKLAVGVVTAVTG